MFQKYQHRLKEILDKYMQPHMLVWWSICLILPLLALSYMTSNERIQTVTIQNVNYNSASADPKLANPVVTQTHIVNVLDYEVSFKVNAQDDNYDNFFQSANGNKAIRLELTQPNILHLVIFDNSEHYYTVSDHFELNRWHDIKLVVKKDVNAEFYLDGVKKLSATGQDVTLYNNGKTETMPRDQLLASIQNDFGAVAVGSGASITRHLKGQIRDFSFVIHHIPPWSLYSTLAMALACLFMAAYFYHLHRDRPFLQQLLDPAAKTFQPYIQIILLCLGAVLITITLGQLLLAHSSSAKWVSLLLTGALLAPLVFVTRWNIKHPIMLALQCIGLAGLVWLLTSFKDMMHWQSVEVVCTAFVFGITSALLLLKSNPLKNTAPAYLKIIPLIVLAAAAWLCLAELPNWQSWLEALHKETPLAVVLGFIALALCWHFAFANTAPKTKSLASTIVIGCIAYATFAILSFRYDPMFLGSSELHWSYYVGVIKSVKEGSWLLWDTPSQYGFLNILIPAIIPKLNAWQSLYVVQSSLLFIAGILSYHAIIGFSPRHKLFAFILVACALYFADPTLIGPALYPSSSVMRFFWCYVLIYLLARYSFKNSTNENTFVIPGLIAWLIGVCWSFESAIYCTAIYFSTLAALSAYRYQQNKNQWANLLKTFALRSGGAIALLALTVFGIGLYYHQVLNVAPDWSMYCEHAMSYGGGFGEMPINSKGAGWIFMLLFTGLAAFIIRSNMISRTPHPRFVLIVGCMGCLIAICTYYLGRAYSSNITAMLPIITLIMALCVKGTEEQRPSPLALIALPLFLLVLVSGPFATYFVPLMSNFKTFTATLEQQLQPPPPELVGLMTKAGIKPDSKVVVYGFGGTNQSAIQHLNWLPTPLQLMEEPIAPERRDIIISRFLKQHPDGGYIIQIKGQYEDRFEDWLRILKNHLRMTRTVTSNRYRVIKFE